MAKNLLQAATAQPDKAADAQRFRAAPHNLEAEQALLGAILVNNEAHDRVSGFLDSQHFFDPLHGQIYEVAAKLIAAGKQATPVTLRTYFENAEPVAQDLTVPQYLGRLAANATTNINAHDYDRTVYDLAIRGRCGWLFFAIVVRTVVPVLLGLNVRHRERLPAGGPATLAANHNSHLDTLVLISLLPLALLPRVRPVAAADYFLRNRLIAWFSLHVIGVIPIKRERSTPEEDMLAPVYEALSRGDIVCFFPEGSRGEPERFKPLKSGIARLAERFPAVPVYPIYLHGLGKALPKGEALLVPFCLDVFVGEPLRWGGDRERFLRDYRAAMDGLAAEGHFPPWE